MFRSWIVLFLVLSCAITSNEFGFLTYLKEQEHDDIPNYHHFTDLYNINTGSGVTSLAKLHDGLFASGGDDGLVRIWDLFQSTVGPIKSLESEGVRTGISALATLSPSLLVVGGVDGEINIWNLNSYSLTRTIKSPSPIATVAALKEGKIACGGSDSIVYVFDVQSGELEKSLKGHDLQIEHVIQIANGNLASASRDKNIIIWDISTSQVVQKLIGPVSALKFLLELSDGRIAASYVNDSTIRIWNLSSGKVVQTSKLHFGGVYGLAELIGQKLASVSYDRSLIISDLNSKDVTKNVFISLRHC